MASATQSDTTFLDPNDRFWSLYIADAEKHDKIRLERWKGDTDGILIFTGLFAATVATFVVASIPDLSADSGDQTVALLSQVLAALANQTQGNAVSITQPDAFQPSASSVWVNCLWMSSLSVALFCALAATLVQQWSRVYSQGTQRRGRPSIRGPVYAKLADGVERFRMEDAISVIVSLLHLAVALFFAGLLILIVATNRAVAIVLAAVIATGGLCYGFTSIIPIFTSWSPYRTPLSLVIKYFLLSVAYVGISLWTICPCFSSYEEVPYTDMTHESIAITRLSGTYTSGPYKKNALTSTYEWLRTRPVSAPPKACSPLERVIGQHHAIRQVCRSVDELHEVEQTCEALIPIMNAAKSDARQRLPLARLLIRELNIIDLLAKLADQKNEVVPMQAAETSGRRIIAVVSLASSLIRCSLPSGIFSGAPTTSLRLDELDEAYVGLFKIETSDLLTHIDVSRSKLLASRRSRQEGIHVALDCFFATLRADMLVVIAAHERIAVGVRENTAKRLLMALVSDSAARSAWLPEGFDHYTDSVATFHLARRFLFDNCMWIFDTIINVSLQQEGLSLLDSLEHFWAPRVEHVRKAAMLYLPQFYIRQRNSLRANLERILKKLGTDLPGLANDVAFDAYWATIEREQLNPRIARLFDRFPQFRDSLVQLCTELQRQIAWGRTVQHEVSLHRAQFPGSEIGSQYLT
ncbi:unnamed protein product [Peniophora sp. CBMAI 1063]|nr:unnamed protein product [Peniophora sp. CBMAI 1063]